MPYDSAFVSLVSFVCIFVSKKSDFCGVSENQQVDARSQNQEFAEPSFGKPIQRDLQAKLAVNANRK